MTPPVRFCCCAHSRGRHQANPFTGQRSGPCRPSCGCGSYRPTAMPVTEPVRLFWPEGTEEETAAGTERPPIWAAAQRAFEDGRLKPLPRMPTVRPESVYEMNLPEIGT